MIEMLELDFWYSPMLQGENAQKNAIEALLTVGAAFVELGSDLLWHPISQPYALATPDLDRFEIMVEGFHQEILSGTLIPTLGYLSLMIDVSYADEAINEKHAHALLGLAETLFPILLPARAWIDGTEDGKNVEKEIADCRLRHLMWANFFGHEYVETYGWSFLANAPGWITKALPAGGLMYVVSPSYANKAAVVSKHALLQYFLPKAKVKFYQTE